MRKANAFPVCISHGIVSGIDPSWSLLTPLKESIMLFRPPSDRATSYIWWRPGGIVQNKGLKTEQRIAANVLGSTPKKKVKLLLCMDEMLTGRWSEKTPSQTARPSFAEADLIQCCLLPPGQVHAFAGQEKVQKTFWNSVMALKTVDPFMMHKSCTARGQCF